MADKNSVLGLIPSSSPYLRSAPEEFFGKFSNCFAIHMAIYVLFSGKFFFDRNCVCVFKTVGHSCMDYS